ncbi:hypothetical protein, conserved [Babesia bigemina]|uniref:Uncharacterized protein n=1 Tax=Babesia bigemina TaxID=5866 RepID=A0A061BSG3_BABBI|nr:hypothetical protein, conserved [Babesia bigemina]CDR71478.1 hypothetical protein, conserved [Babesia bigemina]|eukprot:XP_012770424.1 hypothetical protein, conserved [Babesia bigemina]
MRRVIIFKLFSTVNLGDNSIHNGFLNTLTLTNKSSKLTSKVTKANELGVNVLQGSSSSIVSKRMVSISKLL